MSQARYEPRKGAERVGWGVLLGSAYAERGSGMNAAPWIMWAIALAIFLAFY